ncbi:uncharacterized protein LOC124799131 [Schistocerca piceifrons]|uniref:uncharacterized protein LOC124799131 n=1 Tax=Schistocerca piceifrons TaxID=274613 RepID=UPI001F5FB0AD|nr:uncharacterized protein LOC124799131 [Schistocerca piceifrons]
MESDREAPRREDLCDPVTARAASKVTRELARRQSAGLANGRAAFAGSSPARVRQPEQWLAMLRRLRVAPLLFAALALDLAAPLRAQGQEAAAAAANDTEPRLELLDIRRRPPTRLLGARLRMPCSCQDLTCGCCVGMRIQAFSFDRTACMNLTYDPYEFALVADVLMDGDSLYQRTMSAKNPPPLCMPVPIPYAPSMDMCMRLWDVYTPGLNLHACLDMEARLQRAPVLVLHFDCMVMGRDGVALVKPGEEGLPPVDEPTAGGGGDDIYDEVTEDRKQASAAIAPPVP